MDWLVQHGEEIVQGTGDFTIMYYDIQFLRVRLEGENNKTGWAPHQVIASKPHFDFQGREEGL